MKLSCATTQDAAKLKKKKNHVSKTILCHIKIKNCTKSGKESKNKLDKFNCVNCTNRFSKKGQVFKPAKFVKKVICE